MVSSSSSEHPTEVSLFHLTSNPVTTVPLWTLPVIVMAVDEGDVVPERTAADGTAGKYHSLSTTGKCYHTTNSTQGLLCIPYVHVEWKAIYGSCVTTFMTYVHRATFPASTGALGVPDEEAMPTIDMMYVSPLESPIRVWLLVLPPSTFTLSLLPPPPV